MSPEIQTGTVDAKLSLPTMPKEDTSSTSLSALVAMSTNQQDSSPISPTKKKNKAQHLAMLPMMNPFDFLTEEIIFSILDRLSTDPFSRKSFSLTCKSFHLMESHHRKSLKPLRTDLLPRILHRYPRIEHLDLSLCPRVEDATLKMVSLSCGPALRSINLSRSRFFSNTGLSSLVSGCCNLVEIDLSNGVDLSDLAAKAVAGAKCLERLRLVRCKMVTDMGIGCIAVGCRKLRLVCLKWCLNVGDHGVEWIALKCKEIRCLDLSNLLITEKCLPSIMQLQHLEDLILEGCLGINDVGLSTLQQICKSLKTLDMSHCENVSHVGLSSLTRGSRNMRQLTLAYCSIVTIDLASCLHTFSELQSIKLDGSLITCSGIRAIGGLRSSLKELSLSKCSEVTDESLSFIVQTHRELRKLDITCCRKISYNSIDSITNSCTNLTSLRMESCSLVMKEAFLLIGQRCQNLEELDVTDNEIDDKGLESISRCSKLTSLKLGICLNITDEGLKHIARGCSKLGELDLYRSVGVTDVGVEAVAIGCHALEIINLAYNEKVTDISLNSLSMCLGLKALEIRGCSLVSSKGLSTIAMGCQQLNLLDIKKCLNINDNGMLSLAKFSQNLKQINLSYCSISDVGLLALASINRLQNMTILHLRGLTPNGLAAALLSSVGLTKVKLHASFKSLLTKSLLDYMEARGCMFQWRDKALQ